VGAVNAVAAEEEENCEVEQQENGHVRPFSNIG
jgi:hypothetical protein